jgi:hypothetical protein
MSLALLQQDFRHWLLSGEDAAAARLPGATAQGLAVYQNNYRAQLVNCLEASYPHLLAFIGEEAFRHAAVAHIGRHPPHAWTLDAYADGFAETLIELFPANPDVHELAWIEHALGAAFVAADRRPLSGPDFAQVDWERARLRFCPGLATRTLTTNAAALWRALEQGQPCEGEMLPEAAAVMVWRRDFVSSLRVIDGIEHEALAAMREHGSFATLCADLVARLGAEQGIARAGALLAGWIDAGLVAAIEHADD